MARWAVIRNTAAPGRTLLDFDGRKPDFAHIWAVCDILQTEPRWIEWHRTARGWHLVIEWPREWSPAETVALQAIMGSDPKREALNLMRTLSEPISGETAKYWNILYSRKLA